MTPSLAGWSSLTFGPIAAILVGIRESGRSRYRPIWRSDVGQWRFCAGLSSAAFSIATMTSAKEGSPIRDGQDIHKVTAAAALGIPFDSVTEEQRQIGKGINFGTSFGSKGYTLAKNLKISLNKVQIYIKKYLARFTGVARHLKDVPVVALSAGGTVRSVFDRERRVEGLTDPDLKVKVNVPGTISIWDA